MPIFFEHNGLVYMEVQPEKMLLNSKFMYDVVKSGRQFAVNMNTGRLTVIDRKKRTRAKNNIPYFVIQVDNLRTKAELPLDWEKARDMLLGYVSQEVQGFFQLGRVKIPVERSWSDFEAKVKDIYSRLDTTG